MRTGICGEAGARSNISKGKCSVTQRYEMTIKAEGEVRDADGNLISNETLTGQTVLTEEQAKALLEKFENQEES